jgi:amidase
MNRRAFLGASAAIGALTSCKSTVSRESAIPPFELEEVSIADVAVGLKSGRWTSRKLVELYLGRIDALNRNGSMLGAVIETNPDALEIANLDKAGSSRGPLHGIPILIKDNVGTADKMAGLGTGRFKQRAMITRSPS